MLAQTALKTGLLLCFVVAPYLSDQDAAGSDWLTWRGPSLNGLAAAGQSPPTRWSETENVVWKALVPGRGNSSPIVVGNRVFLTTADEQRKIQSVVAFDRETGKQLWNTPVSTGGFPPKIHNRNTHATATVASDGERLFVSFFHDDAIELTALTVEGKILWQKPVGNFTPRLYQYGYAPSPTIYNALVIVAADYEGGGHLTAFDRQTGVRKWQTPRPKRLSYSSPIVAHVAGRDQLLISGCDVVASYDPNTGKKLWSTPGTTMATCGTMVWDGDLVFASGGYPKSETICVRADGSGRVVWKNNQKCYEQSMLAHNGYIYAVNDGGIAICWRANDGTKMWEARLAGGGVSSSPILVGGNIYVTNERGMMYVYQADPQSFQLVAKNQLGRSAFATPAFCDNQIFVRVTGAGGQETLYCLGTDR
jgi:outer membrane protein assembly factor BamB